MTFCYFQIQLPSSTHEIIKNMTIYKNLKPLNDLLKQYT